MATITERSTGIRSCLTVKKRLLSRAFKQHPVEKFEKMKMKLWSPQELNYCRKKEI